MGYGKKIIPRWIGYSNAIDFEKNYYPKYFNSKKDLSKWVKGTKYRIAYDNKLDVIFN